MTSGIYAYWDNVKSYYVYVGKDSQINAKYNRNYAHMLSSLYDEQKINMVLQKNPKRYEYRVIMEGDYNDWQLNKMEKLCIKSFKTYKPDYPERSVFNFTKGGDGQSINYNEHPNYRIDLNDDEIIDLYVNKRFSTNQIADKLNTNPHTINNRLKHNSIELRKMSELNVGKSNPRYRNDLDDNIIIDMYVNQHLGSTEIGNRLNANESTILKRLKDNGIKIRDHSERNSGKNNPSYRDDLDDNIIIDLYINEKLSISKIAAKLNSSNNTISKRLKNNGIKIRSFSEQQSGKNNVSYRDDIPSSQALLEEYEASSITQKELAKKYNCSIWTIFDRLKKARGG